ncbi:MAG: D-alanyl-D-alanine carboxypeptidase/D-alanyl-D-alanine-endopeptidase [Azoarcus sp.]|nr:D-alanyl-D-alanine carboxypeptidase/D-alanyl-D-alanine-endopeptidase [Azoarcus sp.]
MFSRYGMALVLSFLMPVQAHAAPMESLPSVVRVELERARIPVDAVSVWVQPVDARQPTVAFNAERPMNPASSMKVVTTFAALELLGPERTWTTRIAIGESSQEKGHPIGNLYLVGDGDPVLTYERLWRILRRLRSLGFSTIGGDIVLDHSALVLPEHDPYAFDGKGLRPYNSGGTGLLIHFNTQQLALFPGSKAQDPVRLVAEPPLAGVEIDNQIVTSSRNCDVWFRDLNAKMDKGRLTLTGSLPANCGPRVWGTSPLAPSDYGVAMVRALWWELGGAARGQVRNGLTPADAKTLIIDESVPLGEIVRTMNKWSSNVIARQLLAQVGRESANINRSSTDMVAAGVEATRQCLIRAGIEVSGLEIGNGSGLSREARIRADSLGTLLVRAWQRPWMPDFVASLPIVGRDGTAHRRLKDSPVRGHAHLKTGTINDVKSIAGYVLDQHGRRHAVVMMINHSEAGGSQKAQDALIEWVWSGVPQVTEPKPAASHEKPQASPKKASPRGKKR